MFLILGIVYNADSPFGVWFWLVDPVWQRSLLRINSVIAFGGSCDLKNIYLLRGFGIFSHQTAVIIANNHRRKARRAYIIIANINFEFTNSEGVIF